jgi:hypothetical protein
VSSACRLFLDQQAGIDERFRSVPIVRAASLWAPVLTSLIAHPASLTTIVGVVLLMGFGPAQASRLARDPGRPGVVPAEFTLMLIRVAGGAPR